ncbi:MAG: adenosylmethionine decarboxylase, partial [Candidatus Caenarcaniphilales bacterium]|nr:adenosylmethionine decarboxylase [Candidatus Caenarcaniphilales bacterium]
VKGITQDFQNPNTGASTDTDFGTNFGTMGRHVIADLSGCKRELISSVEYVQQVLEEAVVKAGATIVNSIFHQFSPIGVSGIILLSESHCSIHTWPDEGYAAIDIYTCGEHVFPQVACEHIASKLKSAEVCISSLERGIENKMIRHHNRHSYVHNAEETKILIAETI